MKKLSQAEQKFKDYLLANHIKPFSAVTEAELENETKLFKEWAGETLLPFQEIHVKARDGFPIRVRVFNPEVSGQTLFYAPGNGYFFKQALEPNRVVASRIAHASGKRIVLIDYRLMPSYSWPTPIHDIQDVVLACSQNQVLQGVDPKKIVLGGMSSGAHASLMLALNEKRGFDIQKLILIAGPYDLTFTQDKFAEDEALDYICQRESLHDFKNMWGLEHENMASSQYSPLFATNSECLPQTFIIVGEFDGIRSDSEALYEELLKQGVDVSKIVLPGQTHNNIVFHQACGDEDDAALECARILAEK